jgi:hypothetical protein
MSRPVNCLLAVAMALMTSLPQASGADQRQPQIATLRLPHGGVQPQVAVGGDGTLHLIYFQGDDSAGDIFYVRWNGTAADFSQAVRVNSQPGSAVAIGTIRGAHLALGKDQRVHVAWNGSGKALPKGIANPDLPPESPYRLSAPVLYSRMTDDGAGFEPQRNLMTHTYALDGGGSLAADQQGNVYVVWHASSATEPSVGEAGRAVWVAASHDNGRTFTAESRASPQPTGACGCCGLRAYADAQGRIYVLYRSATESVHRDMYLLASSDQGGHFESRKLDDWQIGTCVMSSGSICESNAGVDAAWETEEQVRFARVDGLPTGGAPRIFSPPTGDAARKHPALACNAAGQTLLAWTEGTGWQKGGAVAWQLFDTAGRAIAGAAGRRDGLPVWSFAAACAMPDGGFMIVY